MNFSLKKLKIDTIDFTHSVCVFIARRKTGKSFLLRDVMSHFRDVPFGVVISPTERANSFFADFVPGVCIKPAFKPEIIQSLINRQLEKIKQSKKDPSIDTRAFIVLDDCLHDKSWVKDEGIRELFFNGRHYHIGVAICLQYALGVPPIMRGNIDYVFLLKEPLSNHKKRLWEYYAGIFTKYSVFSQVFDQVTDNYGVLCINNSSLASKLTDVVTWYRAADPGEFKCCSEKLWRVDEAYKLKKAQRGESEVESHNDELQLMKNAPRVFVKKLME